MTTSSNPAKPVLNISNLRVSFRDRGAVLNAVRGVSFELWPGETLGFVGESGCGKSMTALALLGLVPEPGQVSADEMKLYDLDLIKLGKWTSVRGNRIAMIFQEPATALNPVFTIGDQVAETIVLHQHLSKRDAWESAIQLLGRVGIPAAEQRAKAYPHQLSGGMRQRAMIAQALAGHPDVLIADEPTTALDVTVQAQILDLLLNLQDEFGMAILFISHDLAVISQMADRIAVMYAGNIVEIASAQALLTAPRHPYTQALIDTLPPTLNSFTPVNTPLPTISGTVPPLEAELTGCPFAQRCPLAAEKCVTEAPVLSAQATDHLAACWMTEP